MPNILFLYPLEASEEQMFRDVFRGYKKGTQGASGLKKKLNYNYKKQPLKDALENRCS